MKRLRILVWHIHGSYLNCLVRAPHEFYLPVKPGLPEGYGGKGKTFDWPDNTYEVPAEEVRKLDLDLIIYQTPKNYFEDQYEILSEGQRRLPKIYLEHNTPKGHPNEMRHPVDDPKVLMVHVTHFNNLFWDSGRCPTRVVEHGVLPRPQIIYQGGLDRGIVVVNDIKKRDRVVGYDVWEKVRQKVPLDLFGFNSQELGGHGDVPQEELLRAEAHYRLFFNPIRYTSLPLAVVEAMSIGMPIVALSTTELPAVIVDGVNGFISNNVDYLIDRMQLLLSDRELAFKLGQAAKAVADERFSLERFVRDWDKVFHEAVSLGSGSV